MQHNTNINRLCHQSHSVSSACDYSRAGRLSNTQEINPNLAAGVSLPPRGWRQIRDPGVPHLYAIGSVHRSAAGHSMKSATISLVSC
ncbi:unnamed protein product [Gadus morhua 'NCC']